ncbi:ATPase [Tanacetum coccineum]
MDCLIFTVRQGRQCDLSIGDPSISKSLCSLRHIESQQGGASITLLEITGGKGSVKVNGKPCRKRSTLPLRAGDEHIMYVVKLKLTDTEMKDASDPNDSEKGVMPDENLNGASVDAEMGNTLVPTHELRPLRRSELKKALAKHFGARLLVVESLLLPGGSAAKEVDTTIKESTRPERTSVDDVEKLAINELFEVAVKESKNGSLLLFVKDIEKSILGNTEAYGSIKSKLESLPENVVVIASHTQKSQGKISSRRVIVHEVWEQSYDTT